MPTRTFFLINFIQITIIKEKIVNVKQIEKNDNNRLRISKSIATYINKKKFLKMLY